MKKLNFTSRHTGNLRGTVCKKNYFVVCAYSWHNLSDLLIGKFSIDDSEEKTVTTTEKVSLCSTRCLSHKQAQKACNKLNNYFQTACLEKML